MRQSLAWLFVEAIALVIVIGFFDYITGYEVTFFPFYSIPILLMVWFGNTKSAILISILSAVAWWCADTATGHVYSREWLREWDTIVRFMFFCLVVYAGSFFRQSRDANRARIDLLERSQKLEQEIISISEQEQQRIGRDLHDDLGQHLVAIGFAVDSLKQDFQHASIPGAAALGQIRDSIHNAVRRARDLARGLSPVDGSESGLESALEELVSSKSRLTGVSCSFIADSPARIYDSTQAVHLYRIAQEALNNAVKYSRAHVIVIALEDGDDGLSLRISDDGIGFDPARSESNGMGLNIMRYRARMIGGDLDIQANTPNGTVVSCTIKSSAETKALSSPTVL